MWPSSGAAGGRVLVDLDAIAQNWRTLQAYVGVGCTVAAVVKADGYGLGVAPIATALAGAGCRRFFVAMPEEALALAASLRQVLVDPWIGVLSGPLPGQAGSLDWPAGHGLLPVLNSLDQVRAWSEWAPGVETILHVDTGMARLGLSAREVETLSLDADLRRHLAIVSVISHLSCADDPAHPANERQRAEFDRLAAAFPGTPRSLAASSGSFLGPRFHYDMVRVGAALYGINPTPGRPNPMRQAVTVQARVLQIRDVRAGESVGYGASWTALRPTRLATIGLGYADGMMRSAGNSATCRIGSAAAPVVGRISMDLATLDITDLPIDSLGPGTFVDIIGKDYDLDAAAADTGTIAYELLTRLGGRLSRHYSSSAGE